MSVTCPVEGWWQRHGDRAGGCSGVYCSGPMAGGPRALEVARRCETWSVRLGGEAGAMGPGDSWAQGSGRRRDRGQLAGFPWE